MNMRILIIFVCKNLNFSKTCDAGIQNINDINSNLDKIKTSRKILKSFLKTIYLCLYSIL